MNDETTWKRGHYTNGQLHWEIPYLNDQLHGIARAWHSNGQLAYETPFVNDQRHGIRKHWKEDGMLWSIEKFHRDQRLIDIEFNPIAGETKMELDLITNVLSYE